MRNLEPRDIAGYLPYGLRVEHHTVDCEGDTVQQCKVASLCEDCMTFEDACDYYFDDSDYDNPIVRLILHPMSDLIKPILPDGRIPIVELAKLERLINVALGKNMCGYDCAEAHPNYDKFTYWMIWNEYWNCFEVTNSNNPGSPCLVKNQYQIFDKLHEWHFDYRGLIKEGLAVDINTVDS